MAAILLSEGFDVNERQLAKIRKDNGLFMREKRSKEEGHADEEESAAEEEAGSAHESNAKDGNEGVTQSLEATDAVGPKSQGPQLHKRKTPRDLFEEHAGVPAEIIAKRQERHARLMEESDEKLKTRSRRRRTRGWAGLPADEGLGPRFPSELTLGESVTELKLDKQLYKDIRNIFEQICSTHNVIKKTICGPEKWNEVKNELIGQFGHLQAIFWGPEAQYLAQTQKPMALDVICMDVTKRLRTAGNHITIAEAKNTLGLTPDEAREVRAAFESILQAEFFTGKLDSTKEHWEELKHRWVNNSAQLRMAIGQGGADPEYTSKVRAIEAIARDVQKRNRDEQTKKVFPKINGTVVPSRKSAKTSQDPHKDGKADTIDDNGPIQSNTTSTELDTSIENGIALLDQVKHAVSNGLGPEPSIDEMKVADPATHQPATSPLGTLASQALASAPSQNPQRDYTGMQIDPNLLEAASLPSAHAYQDAPSYQHLQQHQQDDDFIAQLYQAQASSALKPIFFRLSSNSQQKYPSAPKVWLDTLPMNSPNVAILGTLVLVKTGLAGHTRLQKIEAVVSGEETHRWAIDEDDELEAYLAHIGNGKATFCVDLV